MSRTKRTSRIVLVAVVPLLALAAVLLAPFDAPPESVARPDGPPPDGAVRGAAAPDVGDPVRATGVGDRAPAARTTVEVPEAAPDWLSPDEDPPVRPLADGTLLWKGRVIDDRGEPVPRFEVVVLRRLEGESSTSPMTHRLKVTHAEGEFLMPILAGDEWSVYAQAEGHQPSVPRAVALADPSEWFVVVLPRAASVRGRVVDPRGEPVAYAQVRRVPDRVTARRPAGYPEVAPDTHSNLAGEFLLEGLPAGAVDLEAQAEGWAPAAPVRLELAPGEHRDGVDLTVSNGGELVLEWHPVLGPATGRSVSVFSPLSNPLERLAFDGANRIELSALPAGTYDVVANPGGAGALRALTVRARAEVRDGETALVVLGESLGPAVELWGRVTRGDEPVAKSRFVALREEGGRRFLSTQTATDDAGDYRLVLPGPGEWRLGFDATTASYHELEVTVPAVPRHRLDVALPTGRLAGIVFGPDGAAQPRVEVRARSGPSGGHAVTDATGRFAIAGLPAGRYELTAGPRRWAESAPFAWTTIEVVLEGESTHVEVRLASPGVVRGTLLTADREPIEGAMVYLLDPVSGGALFPGRWGGDGVFRIGAVPEGRYLVEARQGAEGARAGPVDVAPGEVVELEIVFPDD